MNATCLHFWRLLRRVIHREPGAWDALCAHLDNCELCREWERTLPECYANDVEDEPELQGVRA